MAGAGQSKPSFGDKRAYVIETVHPPNRGPYSYREIADHLNQLVTGTQPHRLSRPWLSLRLT